MDLVKFSVLTVEEYNTLVQRIERIEKVLQLETYINPISGKAYYDNYEIDVLNLGVRERNLLIKNNIVTIGQLLNLKYSELKSFKGMGFGSIYKIASQVNKSLREELAIDHWVRSTTEVLG